MDQHRRQQLLQQYRAGHSVVVAALSGATDAELAAIRARAVARGEARAGRPPGEDPLMRELDDLDKL